MSSKSENFYALWKPGCSTVQIYDYNGGNGWTCGLPTVVRAVGLGPRYFAFLTDSCVFCIDAATRETWTR
jgi:hypothetical protein